MKRYLINIGLWMFLLVAVIPMRVSAQGRDSLRLDEQGNITLVSEYASQEGISSLSLSLLVDSVNGEKVEFLFHDNNAKVSEFRYNEEEKKLNIYMAGTEALFAENKDSLKIGRIRVQDKNGNDTSASVSVVADSLQYVYGTELKTAEDPELPGVVHIKTSSVPASAPDREEDSEDGDSEADENPGEMENSANQSGGNANKTGDSANKPGSNANKTEDSANKPGSNANKTEDSANKPGSNANKTEDSANKSGSNANEGGSSNGSQSMDNASQGTPEKNPDAEPVIGGNNIRQENSKEAGGTGWILPVAVIAVIIAVMAIAMAVVALKKDRRNLIGKG